MAQFKSRFKPIERDAETPKSIDETGKLAKIDKLKKFELIEEFIAKNPKISPVSFTVSKTNLAEAQMIQPEALTPKLWHEFTSNKKKL